MPWRRFDFRGDTVFVRVLDTGKPIVRKGLVELRYKLGASKSYKTQRENIEDIEGDEEILTDAAMGVTAGASPSASPKAPTTQAAPRTAETIVAYTDGACSGNPGPAGLGVLLEIDDKAIEVSEFVGSATNNYAELMAIKRALEIIAELGLTQRPIHLYTDSAWSLGALTQDWKIKANVDLVAELRAMIPEFSALSLLKIAGHAGDPGNEAADSLAVTAVRRESSFRRERKQARPG